jgi:hypothetical protein
MSAYKYPPNAPKWVQADEVKAATPDGSRVDVPIQKGSQDEEAVRLCAVGWSNTFANTSQADVLVESSTYGWLRVSFNGSNVLPY